MGKIEKVFKNGEVLYAEDLNPIVQQVNDNVDGITGNARAIEGLAKQGYKFAGVAALSEDPGTPAMSVFKIASAIGSYTNYGLSVTQQDGVCAFLYDKSAAEPAWAKLALGIAFPAPAGMVLDNVQTGTIEAQSNHYYNVAEDVYTLAVTLPTPAAGISSTIKIHFYAGADVTTSFIGGDTPVRVLIPPFKSRHEYVLTINYDGHAWNVTSEDLMRTDCLTFRSTDAFSLIFSVKNWEGVLEYSTNGTTWQNVSANQTMNAVNDGHRYTLYLRGTGNSTFGDGLEPVISMTGEDVDCLGNIMTLLDYQHIDDTLISIYAFVSLFLGCSALRTAPELPATTLAEGCYWQMFEGCTGLTQAPELPATTLALGCYHSMFADCTGLTQAPQLPATTLAEGCYWQMFEGCTGLTQAPQLPATTLANECYWQMFEGCTGLTQAPELPATTLANECYKQMFSGCTSLVHAPQLPATTLAEDCYSAMFGGCTSLVQAPQLPATELDYGCYDTMFSGCTALRSAPELLATQMKPRCYSTMFSGCTSLAQAPELPAITLASGCYREMFENCTSLAQAPELPATELETLCYMAMFRGCTSLVQAPELPASELEYRCYRAMFSGCSNLASITMLSVDVDSEEHTENWVQGVAQQGVFTKAAGAVLPTGDSGIPTGWEVVNV